MDAEFTARCAEFLYREALFLDQRRWDEWLALYLPEAQFWIPSWDDDGTLVSDPRKEISLMYYRNREGLEDRVWRIRSGRSAASLPLPRTCHLVTNVRAERREGQGALVRSNWTVHSYRSQQTRSFYGFYEHTLELVESDFRIAKKKIVVLNDVIPSALDVYNV